MSLVKRIKNWFRRPFYYETYVVVEDRPGRKLVALERIGSSLGYWSSTISDDHGPDSEVEKKGAKILTNRHTSLAWARRDLWSLMWHAREAGCGILRYKIEAAVVDSKFDAEDWPL